MLRALDGPARCGTSLAGSAGSSPSTGSRSTWVGQIVGSIGPNGAGKTTAFNVITRLYTPNEGEVEFAGENLLKSSVHGIVRRGIARTFQNAEQLDDDRFSTTSVGAHTQGARSRARPTRRSTTSGSAGSRYTSPWPCSAP